MKTLILVVLDESGSMGSKQADVIGGFNRFLDDQRVGPDACRVTLVKFNTHHTVVYDAVQVVDAKPLTAQTYVPGGNTALLDAVAQAVRLTDAKKDADERVICLIITDGEENSSRETTRAQVQQIIAEREARGDWTFTYLGISPEKWHETGVVSSRGNSAAYNAAMPSASFAAMSKATSSMRSSGIRGMSNFYQQDDSPAPAVQPSKVAADDPWSQPHK